MRILLTFSMLALIALTPTTEAQARDGVRGAAKTTHNVRAATVASRAVDNTHASERDAAARNVSNSALPGIGYMAVGNLVAVKGPNIGVYEAPASEAVIKRRNGNDFLEFINPNEVAAQDSAAVPSIE